MERQAYRAGSFYESDEGACRSSANQLVDSAELPAGLPEVLYGGLVPHAGWVFSGRTAALTLKALAARGRLARAVLFGSDHWGIAGAAAVYERGAWSTPLGKVAVDAELAGALLEAVPELRGDPEAHAREHSIEVQLPLMQVLCDEAQVVPINVSPTAQAVEIGRGVGQVLAARFPDASVIGSTDLTHYGPSYGFIPGGLGQAGLKWAEENDRRLLELIQSMQIDGIISETESHHNACGGGAIAATMAACAAMGGTRGIRLEYTTSAEVMEKTYASRADDSVGYAAVVFA